MNDFIERLKAASIEVRGATVRGSMKERIFGPVETSLLAVGTGVGATVGRLTGMVKRFIDNKLKSKQKKEEMNEQL